MAKRYKAERASGPAAYVIPVPMSREVGRIIVHWAYYEHSIQALCWEVLGLTPAQGRTAVREPRCSDRLRMLGELVVLRGGSWDKELFRSLCKRSEDVQARRDLCAHGIWANHDRQWFVQLARGTWSPELGGAVTGPKKATPELLLMTTEKLRAVTADVASLIHDLKRLRDSASGPRLSSPGISP